MKKLAALLAALLLVSPAYAQKTKSNMTTEINTNLPDNTTGLITPAILRSTLIDMVNSWFGLVDPINPGTGASTFAQINQTGSTSGTITLQTQAAAGSWNWNWPTTAGTAGQALISQGGGGTAMTWQTANLYAGGIVSVNAGNPAPTASTSLVMMGLGSTCAFTPTKSQRLLVNITGNIGNTTASDGVLAQGKFSTGTAPVNGAAVVGGTYSGNVFLTNNANTGGMTVTVSVFGIVSGFVLNVPYWFDIALEALTGGTASFQNVACVIAEF